MNPPDADLKAAELALGEAGRPDPVDRASAERVGAMREAAAAVRAFRAWHDTLPSPAIPAAPAAGKRVPSWSRRLTAACAAAVVVAGSAVAVRQFVFDRRADPPRAPESIGRGRAADGGVAVAALPPELAWVDGQLAPVEDGAAAAPVPQPGAQDGAQGQFQARPGTHRTTGTALTGVAFDLRVPPALPGGWAAAGALPLSPERVVLRYVRSADGQTLRVFVSPAAPALSGDPRPPWKVPGKAIVAGRAGALAVAVEGPAADPTLWQQIAAALKDGGEPRRR